MGLVALAMTVTRLGRCVGAIARGRLLRAGFTVPSLHGAATLLRVRCVPGMSFADVAWGCWSWAGSLP